MIPLLAMLAGPWMPVPVVDATAIEPPAAEVRPSPTVPAPAAVRVTVTRVHILVDGEIVAQTADLTEDGGSLARIGALYDALVPQAEALAAQSPGREGRVEIEADRRVPFHVLRAVMYAAGQAGLGSIRFVVLGP